jgi:hypothetical protein
MLFFSFSIISPKNKLYRLSLASIYCLLQTSRARLEPAPATLAGLATNLSHIYNTGQKMLARDKHSSLLSPKLPPLIYNIDTWDLYYKPFCDCN